MSVTPTIAANLLVPSALEALLSHSAHRLDMTARLQRLHAAALIECAIKGYGALKITDIAARAKTSTASIYKIYKDRDALLVGAMETLFSILASDTIEIPQIEDPIKRVEHLLIAHGEVYAQPLSTWLFRLYASLAWSGHRNLRQTGQHVFNGINAFWCGFLSQLQTEGHLASFDPQHVVPQLLGPIERCTIVWQLGCGDDDDRQQLLVEAARHSAQALFKLWGQNREKDQPAPNMANVSALSPADILPDVATRLSAKVAVSSASIDPNEARERLLLATAVICQKCGYEKASIQEIATLAKVSTATVYKLFSDKADLFASALEVEFRLRVSFEGIQLPYDNRQAALSHAVFVICARANNSDWAWMYSLIMASEISGTPRLAALAQEHRATAEALLKPILASFGDPHPSDSGPTDADIALGINFALGLVERYGVFSLILFGNEACDLDELGRFSTVAAANIAKLKAGEFKAGALK
jgi:AcrR family transcriptional regulator